MTTLTVSPLSSSFDISSPFSFPALRIQLDSIGRTPKRKYGHRNHTTLRHAGNQAYLEALRHVEILQKEKADLEIQLGYAKYVWHYLEMTISLRMQPQLQLWLHHGPRPVLPLVSYNRRPNVRFWTTKEYSDWSSKLKAARQGPHLSSTNVGQQFMEDENGCPVSGAIVEEAIHSTKAQEKTDVKTEEKSGVVEVTEGVGTKRRRSVGSADTTPPPKSKKKKQDSAPSAIPNPSCNTADHGASASLSTSAANSMSILIDVPAPTVMSYLSYPRSLHSEWDLVLPTATTMSQAPSHTSVTPESC
ncbi:hypothetical protein OF83DRAFT_1088882 [Amylostereum chailletii]|nr:hypothetical protein OF83DRAFT_1088882 [Amylostereum chailletii]